MQRPGGRAVSTFLIRTAAGPPAAAVSHGCGRLNAACFSHAYGARQARTDSAVIRIRYKDFSAGTHEGTWLHGRADCTAQGVTLYLVPGLTGGQRRAVIRRLRQEASRGLGPPLPLPLLAVALGLDRVRTVGRMAAAIVRLHPTASLVPSGFAATLMALFVLASAGGASIGPVLGGGFGPGAAANGASSGGAGPFPVRIALASVSAARASDAKPGPLALIPALGAGREPAPASRRLLPATHGEPWLSPASSAACLAALAVPAGATRYGQPLRPCSSARSSP